MAVSKHEVQNQGQSAMSAETVESESADEWWKYGTVYQIYPRSFQDSNGDGIGDLAGIRRRLDYLVALGVDALWISPVYPSPMADFGYDISDYCDIDWRFGSLADFDALAADAASRGLKLILDFVPNHTSDQHPWFIDSRSARDSAKRDWYLWRDPAPDGGPPNNWLSNFGGPAWTFDPITGQYYGHSFLREQPDLNWRNPEVRAAMYDVLRFWLRRGVDGFRIDVLYHLLKDAAFRDNPPNPSFVAGGDPSHSLLPLYTTDLPEVQQIVREMRAVVDAYSDRDSARVLIGELYLPLPRLVAYYGYNETAIDGGLLQGVQLPFNFQLIAADWRAAVVDHVVRDYEAALPPGAAPNWVLGNHDKPRIASRVGAAGARVAAMLLLTLRGTPTLYYGDEIGMTDVPIAPEQVRDPLELNVPGKGLGRDPQRAPMLWDDSHNAGFTDGAPWLPLSADRARCNVGAQMRDATSMLSLYRHLLALRRQEPALNRGSYESLRAGPDVLAYARVHGARRVLVLLNFGGDEVPVAQGLLPPDAVVLASTGMDRNGASIGQSATLRGHEGLVLVASAAIG